MLSDAFRKFSLSECIYQRYQNLSFLPKKLPQENLNIYNHIDAINKVLLCKFALNMAICKTN